MDGGRIRIRGARVLHREALVTRDLLVEGPRITAIEPGPGETAGGGEGSRAPGGGTGGAPSGETGGESGGAAGGGAGEEVLEARGLVALPGLVDLHVHFREPGAEAKEDYGSGTLAALHGGVTSVVEIQNSEPLLTDAARVRAKRDLVAPRARVHFGFYGSAEVEALGSLHEIAKGCLGFKLFLGRSVGPCGVRDVASRCRLFEEVAATGRVLAVHAETDAVHELVSSRVPARAAEHARRRPALSEALAVAEALELAREYGTKLHVFHVTSRRSVRLIRQAKDSGVDVTASVCPHHLLFTDSDVREKGCLLKVNPPIRGFPDQEALWEGLRDGVLDAITTDHAPHLLEEKRRPYPEAPPGVPSVELLLPLLLTEVDRGTMTLPEVVSWACRRPAELIGLTGKGRLEVGADADLVLADIDRVHAVGPEDVHSRAGWSPYAGRPLLGWPRHVMVGGRWAMRDGVVGEEALGRPLLPGEAGA